MRRGAVVQGLSFVAAGAFVSIEFVVYALAPAAMGTVFSVVAGAGLTVVLHRVVTGLRVRRREQLARNQEFFAELLHNARALGWRVKVVPKAPTARSRNSARCVLRLASRLLPARERDRCLAEWTDTIESAIAGDGHALRTALSLARAVPALLWRSWRKALTPQRVR